MFKFLFFSFLALRNYDTQNCIENNYIFSSKDNYDIMLRYFKHTYLVNIIFNNWTKTIRYSPPKKSLKISSIKYQKFSLKIHLIFFFTIIFKVLFKKKLYLITFPLN